MNTVLSLLDAHMLSDVCDCIRPAKLLLTPSSAAAANIPAAVVLAIACLQHAEIYVWLSILVAVAHGAGGALHARQEATATFTCGLPAVDGVSWMQVSKRANLRV